MFVWLTDLGHRNVYFDWPGKAGKSFSFLLDNLDIFTDVLLGISDTQ